MTIDSTARQEPKSTLQAPEVHDAWTRHFRTGENDRFYAMAFDYIAGQFGDPDERAVLDAGCGSGVKTLQLAGRGYRVLGLDFSEVILSRARQVAVAAGVVDRVEFRQGDLTALELPEAGFSRVVCWGVLMHVPALGQAVAELARVLARGGILVVSEGNARSIQSVALRVIKRVLGKRRSEIVRTPAGIECWERTDVGRLMTRQADIPWLIAEFERHGLSLIDRRAGQFTEIYTLLPWRPLRRVVHAFNHLWFRRIRRPGPAYGNLLVFRRP